MQGEGIFVFFYTHESEQHGRCGRSTLMMPSL